MDQNKSTSKSRLKKVLVILLALLLTGGGAAWYIFNEKFSDTTTLQPDFSFNAIDLLNEFKKNDSLANIKYAEKILVVSGTVSEVEAADSTVNIKMANAATGDYIIFAFQQQNAAEAKSIKQGEQVAIKGSCSGGAYSDILETEFITFKRCALNK